MNGVSVLMIENPQNSPVPLCEDPGRAQPVLNWETGPHKVQFC